MTGQLTTRPGWGLAMSDDEAAALTAGALDRHLVFVLRAVRQELGDRPATARRDAVTCLLEAAEELMLYPDVPLDVLRSDAERIQAAVRAASLSVRNYCWSVSRGRGSAR